MEYREWQEANGQEEADDSVAACEAVFSYCTTMLQNAQTSLEVAEKRLAEIEKKIAQRKESHVIRQILAITYGALVVTVLAMIIAAGMSVVAAAYKITLASTLFLFWWQYVLYVMWHITAKKCENANAKLQTALRDPFCGKKHDEYTLAVQALLIANRITLDQLCDAWANCSSDTKKKAFIEECLKLVELIKYLGCTTPAEKVDEVLKFCTNIEFLAVNAFKTLCVNID